VVSNVVGSATSDRRQYGLLVLPRHAAAASDLLYHQPSARLNLIANQLDKGATLCRRLSKLFPSCRMQRRSKYDNASERGPMILTMRLWGLVPGNLRLTLVKGRFFSNASPATLSLTFSGTAHVLVLIRPFRPGGLPSQPPDQCCRKLSGYRCVAPVAGAAVYKWNNSNSTYTVYTFDGTAWSGGSRQSPLWVKRSGSRQPAERRYLPGGPGHNPAAG